MKIQCKKNKTIINTFDNAVAVHDGEVEVFQSQILELLHLVEDVRHLFQVSPRNFVVVALLFVDLHRRGQFRFRYHLNGGLFRGE